LKPNLIGGKALPWGIKEGIIGRFQKLFVKSLIKPMEVLTLLSGFAVLGNQYFLKERKEKKGISWKKGGLRIFKGLLGSFKAILWGN